MDMNQYLELFIEESNEHLQSMNQVLLDLENDMSNIEYINEIFRVAHTIKGMSGTMGYSKLADLTHEMENVLHKVRSNDLVVDQTIIDILFECFDELGKHILFIEDNGYEDDDENKGLVERLNLLASGGKLEDFTESKPATKEEEKSGVTEEFSIDIMQTSLSVIKDSIENGYNAFKIKIVLDDGCMLKAARSFIVFNTLEGLGEILLSYPSAEDIEDEKFDSFFELLFITKEDKESIISEIKNLSEIKDCIIEHVDVSNVSVPIEKEEEHVEEVHVKKTEEAPKKDIKEKRAKNKTAKTVRVDINRLDNLMNLVSELIIVKTTMEENDSAKGSMNDAVLYLERITTNLHDAVMKVRMVPVERVFNRFPRMVRDLAKDLNKNINLVMTGQDTEVDRTIIDEIADPLIHLIRNSIDHGIEAPEERLRRGKSETGTVNLKAYPEGNHVIIEVEDDGNGIDPVKISEIVVKKGLMEKSELDKLSDKEIINLLFLPGFSTAKEITDLSGRGVGLDVVRSKIASIGGTVDILSETGKGSKFIIRLPLTLAIIQALMVYIGNDKYALPLNNISEITSIKSKDINLLQDKEVVLYRENTLPLVRVKERLGFFDDKTEEELTVVIVKRGTEEIGLIVDKLIGQQEIVIKSLGKYLKGIPVIAGATILGNGGVALIIDPNQLF